MGKNRWVSSYLLLLKCLVEYYEISSANTKGVLNTLPMTYICLLMLTDVQYTSELSDSNVHRSTYNTCIFRGSA